MKWPKNKPSSLITRIFPLSWFSKFKHKRNNHEPTSANISSIDFASSIPSAYRQGRFYSLDEDDAFWRISFSDDRIPPRRSTSGINPLRQDPIFSDVKRFELVEAEEVEVPGRNFSEMVSDIKKMRERRGKQRENDVRENSKTEREIIFPGNVVSDSKNQLKEIKMKSRVKESHSRGVKAYSPRSECKIRALEEMKRARTKAKKKEVKSVFESFAVEKSSVDPQRDFKESMVEMIKEKGIGHPDDLEQLLACYLTLNCDRYHDLIITVFQQVWIDLHSSTHYM